MKYTEDAYATCPFYQREAKNRLVCEGITDQCSNVTVFTDSENKNRYKDAFCRYAYGNCILCRALLSKYD